MEKEDFIWEHFKFNADQRLKGLNFFILLSIFADGGVFTAIEKELTPFLLFLLGAFICILSTVFWMIDARSKELLEITIPALKHIERNFSENYKIFKIDAEGKGPFLRYTFAIRILLLSQLFFGIGVAFYGISQLMC